MGSIILAAVTAVVLQAAKPHASFDAWGAEVGGGGGACPLSVGPEPLGLLGMTASGKKDAGGYGDGVSRKMVGFDLEYALPFPMGTIGVGRGWVGIGFAAGSTSYDHVDEPFH